MELLKSTKFKLPVIYYVTDREEIDEIPIGIPYIYGDEFLKESIIRIIEYEILYSKAKSTKLPFNFKKTLAENGYEDYDEYYSFDSSVAIDYKDDNINYTSESFEYTSDNTITHNGSLFSKFIKDSSVYVDISKLRELNIMPVFMDVIENAVETNIYNFAVFNPYMYNKKLEGVYGGMQLSVPNRNLIIIDISGSIPRGVSSTILALAKHLAETFYADLLITGSKSTLYPYEVIHTLDVSTVYKENGTDNDQEYFIKLIEQPTSYETAIVFGDADHPGFKWDNKFNKFSRQIKDDEGKKINQWKINKLISFHTKNSDEFEDLAGYARWFTPKETKHIKNWVKYLA